MTQFVQFVFVLGVRGIMKVIYVVGQSGQKLDENGLKSDNYICSTKI